MTSECCCCCETYANTVPCSCHPNQKYNHCESCSDDEFLKMFDIVPQDEEKFEIIRGHMYPSKRAQRLYKILTKGVALEKGASIQHRTDKTLITVVRALKDNFNSRRCEITCDQCTPVIVEYDVRFKNFIKLDDGGDVNMNSITFDSYKYIQSVIPEHMERNMEDRSKEDLIELLRNIKRMFSEDTF